MYIHPFTYTLFLTNRNETCRDIYLLMEIDITSDLPMDPQASHISVVFVVSEQCRMKVRQQTQKKPIH